MNNVKVVILCGGRGHRLHPLTSNTPKPLVELSGRPILEHIIEFYIKNGFSAFVLCAGYRSDLIREFVSGRNFPADIKISDSGEEAGMLERLYDARDILSEKMIVTYGDTFINIDIQRMIEEHDLSGALATITIANIRSPFGLVKIAPDKKIISFEEKPLLPHYIGHMVLERSVFNGLDDGLIRMPDGEGLIRLFNRLISEGKLNSYEHKGLQITFNTLHEHKKAEEELTKFFTEEE